jgi:hypothetical protein
MSNALTDAIEDIQRTAKLEAYRECAALMCLHCEDMLSSPPYRGAGKWKHDFDGPMCEAAAICELIEDLP